MQISLPETAADQESAQVNWYQNTLWSIHVTSAEGTHLAQLENITFQALIHANPFDGYIMDGWLHQHYCQEHSLPPPNTGRYRQMICHLCHSCRAQYSEMHTFWQQLQQLVSGDDCPEELLFRISVCPGTKDDLEPPEGKWSVPEQKNE